VFALTGDAGAGVVLNRAGAGRIEIAGVRQDVDTPGDWLRVKATLAAEQA
jgi:molybdenum cofactor cytidylyltransferase